MNRFELALTVARDVDEHLKTTFVQYVYQEKDTLSDGDLSFEDLQAIFIDTFNEKSGDENVVLVPLERIDAQEAQMFFWETFMHLVGTHSENKNRLCVCVSCREYLVRHTRRFLRALGHTQEELAEIRRWADAAKHQVVDATKWGIVMSHLSVVHELSDMLAGQPFVLQQKRFKEVMKVCDQWSIQDLQNAEKICEFIRSMSTPAEQKKGEILH